MQEKEDREQDRRLELWRLVLGCSESREGLDAFQTSFFSCPPGSLLVLLGWTGSQ